MSTAYFAHPISQYKTPTEARILDLLLHLGIWTVNPGSDEIGNAFKDYRAQHPTDYMQFFYDLCAHCNVGVFTTFDDALSAPGVPQVPNRVGAGVRGEIDTFFARNVPVFQVVLTSPDTLTLKRVTNWDDYTLLTVDQTRALQKAEKPDYTSA
jgi:hypothetical protein